MKVPFKIEYDGKTEKVVAGPLAIVQYERQTKKSISSWADGPTFEDLALLAYLQLKIEKKVQDEFDDFLATLENLNETSTENLGLGEPEA
jgi:nucleoid-associated protein YejK